MKNPQIKLIEPLWQLFFLPRSNANNAISIGSGSSFRFKNEKGKNKVTFYLRMQEKEVMMVDWMTNYLKFCKESGIFGGRDMANKLINEMDLRNRG
ncbi:hypothetical protein L6452_42646 [Arctium lappa]|uniref:Uncharacterized protein n=1 Tax=Arctium lappa TaxID=4217 RepID=A0ACB8XIB9_ARCLA|nr:hypothetical protein L6452_42646 [Arctium lappa]